MKKHSIIMVVFAVILYFMIGMGYFNWLPGASNWLGTLGCVFVSIAVGMATLKNTTIMILCFFIFIPNCTNKAPNKAGSK